MTTRYQVWLNGEALQNLAPSVFILDVQELPPVHDVHTERCGGRPGQQLLYQRRVSCSVRVIFAVREADPTVRSMVLAGIVRWMRHGGWLTVSTRPGLQLMVSPAVMPVAASADDWTEELTAVFTACEQPFWQECTAVSAAIDGAGGAVLYVPGTADDTVCSLAVTNQGCAVCQAVTVEAGSTRMCFEQLALQPGETLACTHDERARLSIMIHGADGSRRSAYHLRTADSDDELLLGCGETGRLQVSAPAGMHTVISARGCWL